MSQSLFITLDGTDGSGKTTQTKLLVEKLKKNGHSVEEISFPRYGQKSAAMVEEYLNGAFGSAGEVGPHRASIFYAVDRYGASAQIRQWLNEGAIVIANRYVGANMAHQGGKIADQTKRQEFFAWVYDLEYNIFGIPKPDINLILHVTPEISQALVDKKDNREYLRGKRRDIHEDDILHLARAEATYMEMVRRFPEFQIIECVAKGKIMPVEKIHEQIYKLINARLAL